MKKIYFIFAFSLFCYTGLKAQTPSDKDTTKVCQQVKKYTYCEIGGRWDTRHLSVEVWADYGQKEAGKENPVKFNSMIHALNIMASNGWELVTAYIVPVGQSDKAYYYILKKEVK